MGWFSRKKDAPAQRSPQERYNRLIELGWSQYDASRETGVYPGGSNSPDFSGGWCGDSAVCTPSRHNQITGWQREADERAAYLAEGENARQPIYQRAAEPIRYNAQVEEWQGQEVQEWHAPTKAEFNSWANEAWREIQAAPPSNTPDGIYWSPMETEQPDITSGLPQRQLEARNNDGSTELPVNFSGRLGNYSTANLRHAEASGAWVRIGGQDVWVEE